MFALIFTFALVVLTLTALIIYVDRFEEPEITDDLREAEIHARNRD